MSHPGGTRARFNFPGQGPQAVSIPSTTNDRADAILSSTFSTTIDDPHSLNMSLVPFSQRSSQLDASNSHRQTAGNSDAEIVAQRTRTTEIETLYKAKAKKEKTGQLNVAGLLKPKNSSEKSVDIAPQTANIQEISDEELEARSPRQYSGQTLISKQKNTSPTASPYCIPPSNQLLFSKKPSSRQSLNSDCFVPDSFSSDTSSTTRPNSSHSYTATRVSGDDKIKGITTAFNRRHSTIGRTTARFASPIQNTANIEDGRVSSPLANPEQAMERAAANLVLRCQRKPIELEDDEIAEESYRITDRSDVVGKGSHDHHDLRDKRGEKRVSSSEVEEPHMVSHAGKRARTEAYDDLLSLEDQISISPEPESRANRQNTASDPTFHSGAATRDNHPGQDPQFRFFFGQDVDEYISAHVETYEAAKKRWSECSRDEWEKGADELVEKFTQLLDFVKDHVKRKVALYSSIHSKIDEHQKAREGTAEMLKAAKRTLVAKTGVVIEDGPPGFNL